MPLVKSTLENGLRVLTDPVPSVRSVSIGVWCHAGSAHEPPERAGIAHFAEHMLFKGTRNRSAKDIAEAVESRGGILNAFTDKLNTCYYVRCLGEDLENAFDVLSDMFVSSRLEADDLETERKVILEEIRRSDDEPGDAVHDLHLEALWPRHELGRPVIGTPETVSATSQSDMRSYVDANHQGSKVVVSVAGNADPSVVAELAQAKLGTLAPGDPAKDVGTVAATAGDTYVAKDVEQVHFCIGGPGVGIHDPMLHTQTVLDTILGGGMSSRLFQQVREKRGLAYAIGTYGLYYPSGGCLTVYGGTGRETWEELQEVVATELAKMAKHGPTDDEVERTKRMVSGNLALGLEAMNSRMIRSGRNELTFGREVTIDETLEKFNAVTRDGVHALAERLLDPAHRRTTAIGPA